MHQSMWGEKKLRLEIPKVERVVVLGGGNILVSIVRWCVSAGVPISVVTSPRHANERVGGSASLREFLEYGSIDYCITEVIDSSEAKEILSDLSKAFCLSVNAAWIFKDDAIKEVFHNRLFNLHGTRLPQNRGGGGFSWQILMGNRLGFCQLHLVDSGVDTGDIVRTKEFLYPSSCRLPIHYEKQYQKENLGFVLEFIQEIRMGGKSLDTVGQSEYFSTYWPRLNTSSNAWIDWSEDVGSLERFICAFDEPYEGAKTLLNDEKVVIKGVLIDYSDPQFHAYQAGIIYRTNPNWMCVCANGGTLIVQSITDLDGVSLINKLKLGDRLFTPQYLLAERMKRVFFTPRGLKD